MKVIFQGKKGAYSELAALKYFGSHVTLEGYELSEQVIDILCSDNSISYAILPIENSIVGNVAINLDLLYHGNIMACGEVYLPIEHHLLAPKGTSLQQIKNVHSHPIALAQCRDFLNKNNMKAASHYDTAGACDYVSSLSTNIDAAIGPKSCAQYYNLEVISTQIQKVEHNYTRFLILKHGRDLSFDTQYNKGTLAFTLHDHAGALLECLEVFKNYEINLSKLESRPIPSKPFHYFFYCDYNINFDESHFQSFINSLKSMASDVRPLGFYKADSTTIADASSFET